MCNYGRCYLEYSNLFCNQMSYPNKMYTPQKELNQVKKTRYFRIYNPFKTETMLITLDF